MAQENTLPGGVNSGNTGLNQSSNNFAGSGAGTEGAGAQGANSQASGGTSWSVLSDELKSKGFVDQASFERAYLELERTRSRELNDSQQYRTILERLDPYADDINKMIEAKMRGGSNQQGQGDGSALTPDMIKKIMQEQLTEALKPVQGSLAASQNAVVRGAIGSASDRFLAEHPDAKALEAEMVALIDPKKGGNIIVGDPTNPQSHMQALETAYAVVKQRRADKAAAGQLAGFAERGGGLGGEQGTSWPKGMSLDKMRDELKGA